MKPSQSRISKASKITQADPNQESIKLITAQQYQALFKRGINDMSPLQYRVFVTLDSYEQSIDDLSTQLQKSQEKLWNLTMQRQTLSIMPSQPLDQDQMIYSKSSSFKQNNEKIRQLADLIDSRLDSEFSEQIQFVNMLKEEYELNEKIVERGIYFLERIISRKLVKPYHQGFRAIIKDQKKMNKPYHMKNVVSNLVHLLTNKVRAQKQFAFRHILKELKEFGNTDPDIKVKGKLLMALKQYPRQSKRNAFYGWYLKSTFVGESLLQKVSDRLVLDTNINKTTAFYRIFKLVKGKKKVVSPKIKRMTMMIYLYSRIFFERQKHQFFQKLKIAGSKEKVERNHALKLIQCARNRQKQTFRFWCKYAISLKNIEINHANKIVECAKNRQKQAFKIWHKYIVSERNAKKNKKIIIDKLSSIITRLVNQRLIFSLSAIRRSSRVSREDRLKYILNILLKSKIGRVLDGWNRWKNLPQKKNTYSIQKGHIFLIGLKRYIERTLKTAVNSFKNEYQIGQLSKKRTVLKIIENTMSNRKKLYFKWIQICQKYKLMNQCKQVAKFLDTITNVIKSVSNNILQDSKEAKMKQEIIWKIFANHHFNLQDSLRRWRQLNKIEKLKQRMNDKQKQMVLKVLLNVLNNGKQAKIREAIQKFRQNRKIIEIQRNFLKRLLMSKAGLVLIGFSKWKTLPQLINKKKSLKGSKFEAGLKRFIDNTLRRSFGAFKNEFQLGQGVKKRAVIQIINMTMGGQKKLYQRWLNINQKAKLIQECKLVSNIFNTINLVIKSVADNAFEEDKTNKIKQDAINKIFSNLHIELVNSLRRWRQVNTIEKLKQRMNDKQKQMVLKVLLNVLNNGKQAKIREAIQKFRQNRKIIEIQRNFLKRLLMSKAGLVLIGFSKWKTLPQLINKKKSLKGSKFEAGLKRFIDNTLRRSFGAFKNEFQLGQGVKKRAVIQIINMTMGGQKKLYQRWLNINQKAKLIQECKLVSNIFNTINLVIKSVADNAFEEDKTNKIKQDAINKIFSNLHIELVNSLRRWREVNTIEKLKQRMNDKQKQMVLKVLLNVLNNGKQAKIREAIQKFRQNRKIIEIQRNFLKRLLMSKAGLVLIGFSKWKTLPQLINKKKSLKGSKFEAGLKRFIDNTLRRSFGAFKNEFQLGQGVKKRAVIQIINMTMGGQKKLYQRWLNINQKAKLIQECKLVSNIFNTINLVIKSVADNAFEEDKTNKIKQDAINKIFSNLHIELVNSLRRWRQVNTIEKLKQRMNDKQKQMVLKVLLNVLNNGKQAKIREAIQKFRQNRKIIEIQRNFLKRLLMSKAGLVLIGFSKWKTLPQLINKKKSLKGSKFEAGLKRFIDNTLRRSFGAFKNEFQLGQGVKKRAVIQIINMTMGGQKKLYQRWLNINQKAKLIQECKLVSNIFNTINLVIKSVADNAFEEDKTNKIKQDAINKIFSNLHIELVNSLRRWREVNILAQHQRRMQLNRRLTALKELLNVLNNGKQAKIREAIQKFRQNRKIIEIQRNFLKRLLMSKAGLVLIGFSKWKTLPQLINKKKSLKGSKFEAGLKRFIDNTLRRSFGAFKNEFQLGQGVKKRAVIQIINMTMGGQKKLYQRWLNINQKAKLIQECKLVSNIFNTINLVIKSVADNAFEEDKTNKIKQDAINKIFSNLHIELVNSLRRWREVNILAQHQRRMQLNRRLTALKELLNVLNNGKQAKIREAIQKFRQNRKIIEIQRNFLKRLLMSKAGLVLIGFSKWKTLPQLINKKKSLKGSKFEAGLKRFIDNTLRRSFGAFKNEFQLGQGVKKRAVIQIINMTMGGQKKLYQRWLNINQKAKLIQECKLVSNIFNTINLVIKSVADNAFEEDKTNKIKQDAINKIFSNLHIELVNSLRRWREVNTIEKLKQRMNDKQKQMVLKVLLNVLNNGKQAKIREAIQKFRQNRKIIEIQRNFLKRLLMSKAGLVLIGFSKWKTLPQLINKKKSLKGSKFEAGLKRFIDNTLRRSFGAFKNEFQLGQGVKKRAVIQIINMTMGGQKKLYQRWLNINQKAKLIQECKLVSNIFNTINLVIKSVADNAFEEDKTNKIKQDAINKIFSNLHIELVNSLRRWREVNILAQHQRRMQLNRRLTALKELLNVLNNGKQAKIREAIQKFRQNRKIIEIQRNFLKRLLMSKAGLVLIGFSKWKTLPQLINKKKSLKGSKFEAGLKRFIDNTLRRSFGAFKNEFQLGQGVKKRAVIQIINMTMGGQKKLYQRWLNINQKAKLIQECKLVSNIFNTINLVIKSVADNAFEEDKTNKIKQDAINKIFSNLHIELVNSLRRWREVNTIEKLKQRMNDKQKQMVLKVLLNVLNNGKQAKIREAIQKFRQNRKIIEIQRNFLKRLLMSKAGLVLIGFSKWKTLPQLINKKKSLKGSKFEAGLKRFIDNTLRRSFGAFKNEFQLGQGVKKRAVIQIINMTMGGQKKLYQRWLNINQKAKLIQECKLVSNIFNTINIVIKSVADNAFEEDKTNKIKQDAINKIFSNLHIELVNSLRRWREVNTIEKLKQRMNDKQKQMVLKVLLNVLNNGKQAKIREAIQKFRQNRKIIEIQRNFLKRLLMSKAGLVLIGFSKWKTLPQLINKKKSLKGSKFEAGLKRFIDNTLRRSFGAFKNEFQLGQGVKKRAVIQIINMTMGGQKKLYQRWLNINQKAKLIQECKLVSNIFNTINLVIKSVADNAFEEDKTNKIKQDAINKIFSNLHIELVNSLRRWREVNILAQHQRRMQLNRRLTALKELLNVLNNGKQAKIREAIQKFRQNRKIIEIQRNFLKRLLMSKAGLVLIGFSKWKTLPQLINKKKSLKGSKFEAGLKRFIDNTLRRSFGAFKNEFQLGQGVKKRAVIQIINMTMGGQKKLYQRWLNINQKAKLIQECKLVSNIFNTINLVIKSVADNAFEEDKTNKIKQDAINKIFSNLHIELVNSLRRWREVNTIEKLKQRMNDKQKQMVLKVLLNVLNNGKQSKIREAIQKFRQNRKIIEIQRNFLKRLLMSKAGLVLIGFSKWKTLPQLINKKKSLKGSKFEAGLKRFIDNTLRRSFGAFKNEFQLGQGVKKRAVIQIINMTMGGQKKLYQRWLNINQKAKLIQECKLVSNIFNTINLVIKSVADNAFEEDKTNKIKQDAINKIFSNLHIELVNSLRRWREVNTIEKLKQRMNDKQKQMVLKVLLNVLNNGKQSKIREAIQKFRQNRKIIEIQRNFLKRLLMSKAGLVLIGFSKWKTLPQLINKKKSLKGSKFEAGLKRFIDNTLRRSFGAFKNEFQLGQGVKKRAVIQIINMTMGGQKKLYQRWLNINQKAKLIQECKLVSNIFNTINLVIKSVADNAFEEDKTNKIKQDAINKIFSNLHIELVNSLRRWREVNILAQHQRRMQLNRRLTALKELLNVLNNGKQAKIREAIQKFRQNRKIIEIQRNFLKRLLMSKAGLVLIGFSKWKTLPQLINKKKSLKGSKFEAGLKRFIDNTLRRSFGAFKNEFQLGQGVKKRAVIQIINMTMGGQKKLYQRWLNINQKAKLIQECKLVSNIFNTINLVIKSVADNAFEEDKTNKIKQDAINKIFSNLHIELVNSLRRWREVNTIEKLKQRMNDKQKQMVLKVLLNVLNNGKQAKIREAIQKFRQNRKIIEIQRNFLKRLLMSKAGLVLIGFSKWKTLPQLINKKKSLKGSKFEAGLKRFIDNTLRRSFGAFKNEFQLGQGVKKRAVIQIINMTMGGQKKLYQRWLNINQKAKLIQECKLVSNIFNTINLVIKSVADNAFEEDKTNKIKQDAINKIFSNLHIELVNSLRRWREVNTIEKLKQRMNDKQKQMVLKVLLNVLNNGKQAKIREAIQKFRQNRKIIEIQRNFLKRLLMSKAGLVLIGFSKWKTLPQLIDKKKSLKGSKFEAGLKRFIDKTLGKAYRAFKNQYQIGQNAKKRAVIQIINMTNNTSKRFYLRWLQSLYHKKMLQKFTQINNLFSHLTTSVSRSYNQILDISKKKTYTLEQFQSIQSYCNRSVNRRIQNCRDALFILYKNYLVHKKNPWFKRSAQILALNTHINTQKSFWRLRYNTLSTGVVYNAAIIVKLKKLFNNVRKYYELNMFKIFLTIDKYGKYMQQLGANRQRQERMTARRQNVGTKKMELPVHHNMISRQEYLIERQQVMIINQQQTHIIQGAGKVSQSSAFRAILSSRAISIQMMDRIFKKNIKKCIGRWRKGVMFLAGGLEKTISIFKERSDQYQIVSRLGAIEAVVKIIKSARQRLLIKTLNQMCFTTLRQSTDNAYDRSLDQRLELINRQNILMQQIRSFKRQNEQLIIDNQTKQKCLRECNETVTLLSLRINYMITQKFVGLIEKVYEGIEFRHVNDAFDSIIEEANVNFERQEMLQDF